MVGFTSDLVKTRKKKLLVVVYGYVSFIMCVEYDELALKNNKYCDCKMHLVMITILCVSISKSN